MLPRRTHFAALALALVVAACDDLGPEAPETITELPRSLTEAERTVIARGNDFGLALAREVVARDARPNVILSPFSASMALGMTLNGASGATFDAMRTTLGFDGLSEADINASYAGLIELLTALDPTVRFDVANSVWANRAVTFHASFLEALTRWFAAQSEVRDFTDPATLAAINGWVDRSTNGLIDRILDELDPDLVLLLINAIYFEGAWTTQFDPADTAPGSFQREDGSTLEVPLMRLADVELPVGRGDGFSALELPYGGEAFSMLLVMPELGSTARDLLASLDDARWREIRESLTPQVMDGIRVPKFTLRYDAYLNDALRAMGMDVAFRRGADFTRMSPIGDGLCIDFVRQKTYVEVDEEGTKAAAVTAVGIRPVSFNGFFVDRPFVVAIQERLSGTILFLGVIGDPTYEDPGAEPYDPTCR